MAGEHREIEFLFHDARLILDSAERAAFLDKACGSNHALRARIEKLLAAEEELGSFLRSTDETLAAPRGVRSGSGVPTIASPLSEKPGTVIGRYKLLQQIGEGGFGVVYMAEQEQPVRRKVALKIIKLGMDTLQVIARFEAERQALAMMDHPHIAKVLDAGATDTGRPYFVMELVKGMPITDYCDKENVALRDRLSLFMQVCGAVQHAHQKGIIHRDIKPSNILVTLHDGKPVPKVIDFGIAKATEQKLTERTMFTEYGQFIGTPEYMSPEQAEMSGLDIDTRSDIYSLGVVLYELLTGATPFDMRTLRNAAIDEIRRVIREDEPSKPSTRISTVRADLATVAKRRGVEPQKLCTILRGDLDWIVMKALEKDRQRRYDTPNGLGMDVARYLSGEAVLAAPPSTSYRLRKFVRRNKGSVIAGTLVAVALLLGIAGTTWGMFWALNEKDRADAAVHAERAAKAEALENAEKAQLAARRANEERERARIEAMKAERVSDFTTTMLSGVDPEYAKGADTRLLRTMLDEAAMRLSEELFGEPDVRQRIHATIGKTYWTIAQYEDAEKHLKAAFELASTLYVGDHEVIQEAIRNLASLADTRRDVATAEHHYHEALQMARRLNTKDNLALASTASSFGNFYAREGRYVEAEPLLLEAIGLLRANGDDQSRAGLASALSGLAVLRHHQERVDEAKEHYLESLQIQRSREHSSPGAIADVLAGLGALLFGRGDLENAETHLSEAIEIRRTIHKGDHPKLALTIDLMASLRRNQMRLDEALTLNEESCRMQRRLFGDKSAPAAKCLNATAVTLSRMGRLEEALQSYQLALDIQRALWGADHPETITSLSNLGQQAAQLERTDLAEAALNEAYQGARKLNASAGFDQIVLDVTKAYANFLVSQSRFDEGEKLLSEVVDHKRRLLGANHANFASAINDLAVLYMRTARPEKAIPLYRQAMEIETQTIGPRAHNAMVTRCNLAGALRDSGHFAEAEDEYRTVIAYAQESLPEKHWIMGFFQGERATNFAKLDRLEEALEGYQQRYTIYSQSYGVTNARTERSVNQLAKVLSKLGRLHDVELLRSQRVKAFRDAKPDNTAMLAGALTGYAESLCALERCGEALAPLREAQELVANEPSDDPGTRRRSIDVQTLLALAFAKLDQREESVQALLRVAETFDQLLATGKTDKTWCGETIARVVATYELLHAADSDQGYDAKAAEWKTNCESINP